MAHTSLAERLWGLLDARPYEPEATAALMAQLDATVLRDNVDDIPLLSLVMMEACEEGNPEKLVRLLEAGMPPDTMFHPASGARLLHWAVMRDVVASRCLLEHGAAANVTNHYGESPLMYAVSLDTASGTLSPSDHVTIVRMLLDHGAELHMRDSAGNTARDVLLRQTAAEPQDVQLVLDALA